MMRRTMLVGLAVATATVPAALSAQGGRAISQSERAAGAKAHPQLLNEFGGTYAGPQSDYVRRVGQRIAVQSGLSNAQSDFTITLLNSPVNNAFAIPGGYVYLTRQLLGLMNDEAELAFVMGHEVGHVAARHSESRNRTSTFSGIGAAVLGVLTGSPQLAQLANVGSQLFTLRFSRNQEYQADDLGVSYLARAGYDTMGGARVLASLAAQTAIEQRESNQPQRSMPSWASTHPDPASRINRAAANGRRVIARNAERNTPAFLAAIDGMIYGDDPRQGIVEGRNFRHPDLRLAFTVPEGFAMQNATDAVTIAGNGGKAQFSGGRMQGDLRAHVAAIFRSLSQNGQIGVDPNGVQLTRIGGFDAAIGRTRANTQSGAVDLTVVAYQFDANTAYHFVTMTQAGQGDRMFAPMFDSMRRLTTAEAAAIKPRRLRVVTAGPRDTVASLSARMAYPSLQVERFRTLNAIPANGAVRAGQKYKIIVQG